MTKTGLASSVVAVVLLASGAASAQSYVAQGDSPQWLKDRRYGEGEGVLAGDFELHPGIAGEAGYDSNWFLRSNSTLGYANSASGGSHRAVRAGVPDHACRSISPRIGAQRKEAMDTQAAQQPSALAFRASVSATDREFISLAGSGQPNSDISEQRNVGVSADARLDIAPANPISGGVFASYGRVIQPNVITADPDQSFVYDTITGGADSSGVRPGSGTLDWRFGYRLQDAIFETSAGSPYDNLSHAGLHAAGSWAFPSTDAARVRARRSTTSRPTDSTAEAAPVSLVTSTPIRARLGINGLITDRFAVDANVGWGASFFSVAFQKEPQYDSVIGHAEVKWFLSASPGVAKATQMSLALSSIALGYDRNFSSSFLGSFYGTDRGYLKFSYFFAGRALVSLEGGVGAVEYPELFWSDFTKRHDPFTDVRADATLFSEYRFTNSLGLNVTLRYTANISNTQLEISNAVVPPNAISNLYDMSWQRFEAYLGVRWFL